MRVATLVAFLLIAMPASAEVPAPRQVKCPVGGETFTYMDYAAYSTFGARLDGKPFGSTAFPLRLPVCPGNGFIVLKDEKDYSTDEIAKYGAIIASDAFKALTANETTYYRAWFLEREAGAKPESTAWLLLQATWQADSDPVRHKRYQEEFVAFVDSVAAQLPREEISWWYLQHYAANAERQVGRFEAAVARLASIRNPGPPESIDGDPDWSRDGFLSMITKVETLAKARDGRLDDPDRR